MTPFRTANVRIEQLATDRAALWLDVADRPVNVFNRQVLADFAAALDHVAADGSCQILFVSSAKPSGFIAGADLHEFAAIRSSVVASTLSAQGQELFDKLANLPQTTIAVIAGTCLGGGLECALACDYRIVVDHPKTQLGLPEIELGLIPAWGGTQRLPRVIGLEPALRMILGRKRLNAQEALRWRLANVLATSDKDLPLVLGLMAEQARRQGKRSLSHLPLLNWRQRLIESHPLGRLLIFRGSQRLLRERVPDDMPAPADALDAVRIGLKYGMDAGLAYEREAVGRLAITSACRNLVTLFFLQEQARKRPAPDAAQAQIRKVGIVGAGTMGAGIAQVAAIKGFEVVVQEVNEAALAAGMQKIEDLFGKAVEHRVLSQQDAQQKLAAIGRTTTWQGFADVDLVVEAVIEEMDAKRAVFRELEQRTRPTAFLATNTSSLLVAGLQESREHPERIGGLHFFNPVHKMPLVEVVRGPATDEPTLTALRQFAIALGKTPVVVKDSPGFLVNRILMAYLNEAIGLLWEAGMEVKLADRLMRRFGMLMGPFEVLDQVGIDVANHVEKTIRSSATDAFPSYPLLGTMVERGWLGAKSGRGFYLYRDGKPQGQNAELPRDVRSAKTENVHESRDRMVLLMVNQAAACLEEGIAVDAPTVDLAMVFGTGWAPHRGGPLRYADDRGLAEIVRVLMELSKAHGPRFEPCNELRGRAERGESFYQDAEAHFQRAAGLIPAVPS
jgi:3-hydroxyacyl-CoA dehydrogenase/enoyl-CoA hydratase/3-hydroxybutyryl-CoA epimerase